MIGAEDPTIVPAPASAPSDVPTRTGEDSEPSETAAAPLQPGATVGRYIVIEELGAGAMGRVYSAYDPRLDRRVALKLLRHGVVPGGADARHAARLLREAQALAKLAHPNVVAVHDVEQLAQGVAIAMEYLGGGSLRSWMQRPHAWRETLAVFVQAGRGLAAAHAAGVIHRDFKPDNVMLGDDGRVRVVDFGLARNDAPTSDPRVPLPDGVTSDAAMQTHATVGIAGTPAYMAPELYGGAPADTRSDQFSFCVALYEALYGERPFAGNSLASVAANVARGQLRPAPRGTAVPGWVYRVLARGLAAEPAARHRDMDQLVAALLADPSAARRRVALAGVAAMAIGGVAVVVATRQPPVEAPCAGAGDDLQGVWDDEVRSQVETAIVATGASWAPTTAAAVRQRVDAWVGEYRAMAQDSCLATRVRGEQSEALLDLRSGCLAARRRELVAAKQLLVAADLDVARESVRLVEGLPRVAGCGDVDALQQAVPPPDDPAVRAQVETLRGELADAHARTRAGKYDDAAALARAVAETARGLDYAPLRAAADHAVGYIADKQGDFERSAKTMADAALLAVRAGDDLMAARAMADVVYEIGAQLSRVDEGLLWARHAEAIAARTGDPVLIARVHTNHGTVLSTAGRLTEAEAELLQGLQLRERVLGSDHSDVAISLANLASVYESLGRLEEARTAYRRALAIDEAQFGERHPRVGALYNNMSQLLLELGAVEEARRASELALSIFRESLAPDHPNIAAALGSVAMAQRAQGDFEGARTSARAQLDLYRRRLGDDHPDLAISYHNLGALEHELGDDVAARASFEKAIAHYTAAFGEDHYEIGGSLAAIAELDIDAGAYADARPRLRRVMALFEHADASARVEYLIAMRSLAQCDAALGDRASARAGLERALAGFGARPEWASQLAQTRLRLAELDRDEGRSEAARALLEQAAATCPSGDSICDEIDAARRDLGSTAARTRPGAPG
ncbi:MAG: serine/threonine-protein kinase [Nannocystaceae bacterium]|nr:serine/threonine-protein kinase [Nannocystaceae bacterium]